MVNSTTHRLSIDHYFSSESSLSIASENGIEETQSEDSNYILYQTITLLYSHGITEKLTGEYGFAYVKNVYKGNEAGEREDVILTTNVGFDYLFRNWLMASFGFSNYSADSTDESLSSKRNEFFIGVSVSL